MKIFYKDNKFLKRILFPAKQDNKKTATGFII